VFVEYYRAVIGVNMPLLKPNKGESKKDFVNRFIEDDKMINEFPEIEQRTAVAISQWEAFGELKKSVSVFEYNQEIEMQGNSLVNPQWILVFPAGRHFIQKYDDYIKMDGDFFEQVGNAFNSPTLSKPFIDKDHEFAESYGDIIDFRYNVNYGMEFKVQFNQKGLDLIKNHEYSYISPAWGAVTDTYGEPFIKLMAISLVNFPAFEGVLPTLQQQMAASKFGDKIETCIVLNAEYKKESNMDTKLLAKEFGLADEASVDSIYDKVVELKKINEDVTAQVMELKKELDTAKSNEETALSKAQELGAKLAEIETAELSKEAEAFVEDAIKVGKLHPTQKDLMLSKYIDDKEFVIALLKDVPEADDSPKSVNKTETEKVELSKEDADAMRRGGMDVNDPEEVKAFMAAKRK
jgi:phage I-like protein